MMMSRRSCAKAPSCTQAWKCMLPWIPRIPQSILRRACPRLRFRRFRCRQHRLHQCRHRRRLLPCHRRRHPLPRRAFGSRALGVALAVALTLKSSSTVLMVRCAKNVEAVTRVSALVQSFGSRVLGMVPVAILTLRSHSSVPMKRHARSVGAKTRVSALAPPGIFDRLRSFWLI